MFYSNICVFALNILACSYCLKNDVEPQCSKFHYEEQLLEKMIRLEIKFETLLDNVGKMKTNINEERRLMNEERIAGKEDLDNWMQNKESDISSRVEKMENNFEVSERRLIQLSNDFTEMQNRTLRNVTDIMMSLKKRTVAFEAHVVPELSPARDEYIVFTDTLLNEGDGYDNTTGVFTVPEDGMYLIMVQFCIRFDKYIHFDILWNGIILTTAKFSRGQTHQYSCYSTQTAVKASTGENIWIVSNKNHLADTLHNSRYFVNSFTGVLVN